MTTSDRDDPLLILDIGAGETLACHKQDGRGPTILWLGGLRSDMGGTKASALAKWAKDNDRALVRFDYRGHGRSSGDFENTTISHWRDDALAVLDQYCPGPVVLVGSSMGGWIALLVALARKNKVQGMVLIAPAPDFTENLMWAKFDEDIRRQIIERGVYYEPSPYDDGPMPITRALIEDGRDNLILTGPIDFTGPVRILQGVGDTSVPWHYALELMGRLTGPDTVLSLSKAGDHSLSSPDDLARLFAAIEAVSSP